MDGPLSISSLVLTSSTPSLSSTPLVAPSHSMAIKEVPNVSSIPVPNPPVVSSFFVSQSTISPSGFKPPTISLISNVSSVMSKTVPSTAQSSSVTSSPLASLPAHFTDSLSAAATAPPLTTSISNTTRLPSTTPSSLPNSVGFSSSAPAAHKPTPSSAVSSKASGNSTASLGSSSVPVSHAVASNAANDSSMPARVNGSISTHTFVPQVSTSDLFPFRSITLGTSPTSTLNNAVESSGFFANRGAVAGVFVVVALAVLALAALLFFGLKRYCRPSPRNSTREPTLPELAPSYNDDMHYRRASQMRALGSDVNRISAGGSRPLSGHSIASEASHAFSRDTHRSTDPILPLNRSSRQQADASASQGYATGSTNGYKTIPFPPSTKPFANQSKESVQSVVESLPSIYPPTLPTVVNEEEEKYWRHQGFERIVDPQECDRIVENHAPQQQPTPPESMLGLWCNGSQSTFRQHSSEEEEELVRNLHPRMEPISVHKGTSAPIASLPRLQPQDGRCLAIGGLEEVFSESHQ